MAGERRQQRAPRGVHLDDVVDRVAAPQPLGEPEADTDGLRTRARPLQLLEKQAVGPAPAEGCPEGDEEDVDSGHGQPMISWKAAR